MRIRPVLSNLTDTRPRNRIRERDRNVSLSTVAVHESMMTGVRKDPRSNTGHACHCQKPLDGSDHGSGMEVSGPAVSVPRGESPTTSPFLGESLQLRGCESLHPFQPPPSPTFSWEVHELPSEHASDASHQIDSVSSDRSSQEATSTLGGVLYFCDPPPVNGCTELTAAGRQDHPTVPHREQR
jgi:hypothetical protein